MGRLFVNGVSSSKLTVTIVGPRFVTVARERRQRVSDGKGRLRRGHFGPVLTILSNRLFGEFLGVHCDGPLPGRGHEAFGANSIKKFVIWSPIPIE
jgi:hypothetical protein